MTRIAVNHNFRRNIVFAGMRDGAAVNGAVITQLLFFYTNIMDVICFSHTINNVGCHFIIQRLDTFRIQSFGHIFSPLGG